MIICCHSECNEESLLYNQFYKDPSATLGMTNLRAKS
jgi:hypothetical protein